MNRVVPSFVEDEAFDKLSIPAEVFFRRLWSEADDFGRFDGRLQILKSRLYPLRDVRLPDISRLLLECEKVALVACYDVESKPYIQILRFWNQNLARSKAKYPEPPSGLSSNCNSNDTQVSGSCSAETETETETETRGSARDFSISDFLAAAKLPDVNVTPEQATECFDFYAAQGFVKSNGQLITAIAPLLRGWKRREGGFSPRGAQSRPQGQNSPSLAELKLGLKFMLAGSDNLLDVEKKALKSEDIPSFQRYVPDEYESIIKTLSEPFSKMKDYIKKTLNNNK